MSDSVSPICRYRAALAAINLEIPNRIFQHSRPKPACFLTFFQWLDRTCLILKIPPVWHWMKVLQVTTYDVLPLVMFSIGRQIAAS